MVFSPCKIGTLQLQNRIVRSATFEGMADEDGVPTEQYISHYKNLFNKNIGLVITGFMYVNRDGKAIQPGQAALDSEKLIDCYKEITKEKGETPIFAQISHCGRQSGRNSTGGFLWAPSAGRSLYFREKPDTLTLDKTGAIIEDYVRSAEIAKASGFDGVQLHCAHGYLIHQFLLPSVNKRSDIYGIDRQKGIGTVFPGRIIDGIRKKCGEDFPLAVKISGSDDYLTKFSEKQLIELISFLNSKKVDAIEMSYGTMDYPLNIMRGKGIPVETILNYNLKYRSGNRLFRSFFRHCLLPVLKRKVIPFSHLYNSRYAKIAKEHTDIPVILVGGIRSGTDIDRALNERICDLVSFCRPFICESDFALRLQKDRSHISGCINCNLCLVMCDSQYPTRCWREERP